MQTQDRINAKDLRIGNIILFSPEGKKAPKPRGVIVKSIPNEKSVIVNDNGLDLQLFYGEGSAKGIPITEERLLRFGFDKLKATIHWDIPFEIIHLGVRYRVYLEGTPTLHLCLTEEYYPTIIKIPFIHSLQNFFLLTGTELTISKPATGDKSAV